MLHALELGLNARHSDKLTSSVATFYNSYDKLRSLETGAFPILLANGVRGTSYGAEASAIYQPRAWWRLNTGYTFERLDLDTEPGSSDTSQVKQEGDSPRHRWYLQSSISLPHDVAFDLSVRAIGRLPNQDVPPYVAWDGRLGWQACTAVELAVVGRNLFDGQHAEFGTPASRREIGRSVYGRVTCRFLARAIGPLHGLILFSGIGASAAPAGTPTSEYDLKAVFLFQFAHFVTWPARTFTDESSPITIGVLGEDPFGAALDDIVAGELVGGRRLVVRRYQFVDQVDSCHVLYISPPEAGRLPSILAKLKGRSVLTVGDTKDFVARGGIVGFTVDKKRLKLRVNLAAADSEKLTISSKLLRQAEVVRGGARR